MKQRRSSVLFAAATMFFVSCSSEERSTAPDPDDAGRAPDERPQAWQAAESTPPVDRQQPGSENSTLVLNGRHGRLAYRRGCLLLVGSNGEETGLVIPSYALFDGKHLTGKLKRPTGESIITALGKSVTLSGRVIENPRDGSYNCDTDLLLIADYF